MTAKKRTAEPLGFREPRGHAALMLRLFEAARSGRLPHALLFEGPEGTGKYTAMRWFAAGLLCAEGPGPACGDCGPCKRVRTDNHPDLFIVDPVESGEERLRVNRIAYRPDAPNNPDPENCVESFLDLRAVEAEKRPVLLREAHRMNASAQNALLKTLEEPRPGVVLILETHRSDLLLDTILSRCVRVRTDPLSSQDGRAVLRENGLEDERAARLTRWAEGAPGRALSYAERGAEEAVGLLAEALAGDRDALASAALLAEIKGRFTGGTPSAKARDRARLVLDFAVSLARDAVRIELAGADPEDLPFGPEAAAARAKAGWTRRLEQLLVCRADVERNVGPDGLFERALLVLAGEGPILSARR